MNSNKNILGALEHIPLSEIQNTEDGTETFLIGKVKTLQIRSAKIKGVFIEEYFAIVNLVDPHGSIEIILYSEKLQQLKKMNLDDMVVFKVKIINKDSFKSIEVTDIRTIDEAKKLAK